MKFRLALISLLSLALVGCNQLPSEDSTTSLEPSESVEPSDESSEVVDPYAHFGDPNWMPTIEGSLVGKYPIIPGVPAVKNFEGVDYTYAWSDEFSGDTLNENFWNIEVNNTGGGNGEKQAYTQFNLEVGGGFLQIHSRQEQALNRDYTSGRINSRNKVSYKYGYIEAAISFPAFKGVWPAFWMMGSRFGWPKCGEIDIMEAVNTEPKVHSTLHYGENNSTKMNISMGSKTFASAEERSNIHHYAMVWDENYISTYLDGVRYGHASINTSPRVNYFHQDFFIILNQALGGQWPGDIGNNVFNVPRVMYVDYVRVYQPYTYEK